MEQGNLIEDALSNNMELKTDLNVTVDEIVVTPDGSGPTPAVRQAVFENDDINDANADSEDIDDEENFLCSIEKIKEEAYVEEAKAHHLQPHRTEDAPRLLQGALKEGVVKADESETEEDEKKDVTDEEASREMGIREIKAEEHDHHIHARVRIFFIFI
jgi:hypothetical protein